MLDLVCVRFGECEAGDVETAYRCVFANAGVPFSEADRLADQVLSAIRDRNVQKLWPDSVRYPAMRK
jgi:hypothetical protein